MSIDNYLFYQRFLPVSSYIMPKKLKKNLQIVLALIVFLMFSSVSIGSKRSCNRAFVHSDLGGIYYARAIPEECIGTKGYTQIYRVENEQDKLLHTYNWFNRYGIILAWSPIVGKVAVLTAWHEQINPFGENVEISFFIDGQHLRSYTINELIQMGAEYEQQKELSQGKQLNYKILGCEQILRTNEYRFVIIIGEKKVFFDILTGKIANNRK